MTAGTQFGLFCFVGVLNTALDFLIYNLLTRKSVSWSRVRANVVSASFAMAFSFTMNLLFVFVPKDFHVFGRAAKFVAVTLFSGYVIQNSVIHITSRVWPLPVNIAKWALRHVLPLHLTSGDFMTRNVVKGLAVGAGLLWNFFWYKLFVFR